MQPVAPLELSSDSVFVNDKDFGHSIKQKRLKHASVLSLVTLAWASIGVIYGDIGTSPLYTFAGIFATLEPTHENLMGATSLIFWTITLLVLVKYVGVVMLADDDGEGGTLALFALISKGIGFSAYGTLRPSAHQRLQRLSRTSRPRPAAPTAAAATGDGACDGPVAAPAPSRRDALHWRSAGGAVRRLIRGSPVGQRAILVVTLLATSMVIGDGVLTPAISVVSAVSGLGVATPVSQDTITGISIAILVALFAAQRLGTQGLAYIFSPVVTLWLAANLGVGAYNISAHDTSIFGALSPHHIVTFFQRNGHAGWEALGGVFLCVTGAEALYADLGHFSHRSIALGFTSYVYPCIIVAYLGQGAYLLEHPEDVGTAFWSAVPHQFFWPMLVLATLAAIVASQALITGCFSIIRQAMTLGVFPRLHVRHTSLQQEGQIYIGFVNWVLMLLCVAVVAGFGGDGVKLGNAYGIAVSSVMLITTTMAALLMGAVWELTPPLVMAFWAVFTAIEGVYWSANIIKLPHGGWFTLAVSCGVLAVKLVWWLGSARKREQLFRGGNIPPHLLFTTVATTTASGCDGEGANADTRCPDESNAAHPQRSSPEEPCNTTRSLAAASVPYPSGDHTQSVTGAHGKAAASCARPSLRRRLGSDVLPQLQLRKRSAPTAAASETAVAPAHAPASPADHQQQHQGEQHVQLEDGQQQQHEQHEQPAGCPRPAIALSAEPLKALSRLRGVGLYYSEQAAGVPPVLTHFLRNVEAIHEVCIFVTVRFLPLPRVEEGDRLLARAVPGVPDMYQVVARYGYMDVVDHGRAFVNAVMSTIIRRVESSVGGPLALGLGEGAHDDAFDLVHEEEGRVGGVAEASDEIEVVVEGAGEKGSNPATAPAAGAGGNAFGKACGATIAKRLAAVADSRTLDVACREAAAAVHTLMAAAAEGVVYYFGRTLVHAARRAGAAGAVQDVVYGELYRLMSSNAYEETDAWLVPKQSMVQLGMVVEL